ncbi:translational repressor [Paraglaciecola Antarctic GD virus 1]|nr:translational repressor [Paraglaciecola Antarctic GD virus 1]
MLDNMLEIELADNDAFLKIRETLTRMGIASNKDKKLYQSCHILQKRGLYYITHFKELLRMDGRTVDISDEDFERRTDMAKLLQEWKLCSIIDETAHASSRNNLFRVISYKNSKYWDKISKYQIGNSEGDTVLRTREF